MVKGFRSLSLKKELVDEVEEYIEENKKYKNLAEFVSEATRLRLEELKNKKH